MSEELKSKIICGLAENRECVLSVLVKKRYNINMSSTSLSQELECPDFIETDVYNGIGNPEINSVSRENENIPYKSRTDVVLTGVIKTYQRKQVTHLNVGIEVSDSKKILNIFGDRFCQFIKNNNPHFTEPMSFIEMPIEYERSYGGKDKISVSNEVFSYPRNAIGTGYALFNSPELIDGLRLPNFESTNDLLTPDRIISNSPYHWNQQPFSYGFGFQAKNSYPRASYVGVVPPYIAIDESPREAKLGLVKEDQVVLSRQFKLPSFDVKFTNGASTGMAFPHLKPNTTIRIANMFEDKRIVEFKLPEKYPIVLLDVGNGKVKYSTQLQTVLIDIDTKQVDMVWQACHSVPSFSAFSQMNFIDHEVISS